MPARIDSVQRPPSTVSLFSEIAVALRQRGWSGRLLLAVASLTVLLPLAGCAGTATPTLVSAADTPVVADLDTRLAERTAPAPSRTPARAPQTSAAVAGAPTPGTTATLEMSQWADPSAENDGLRPGQARLYRPPHLGPEATLEWRPPPMPVPLSLHPNDHYWLTRPIPSDKRNYDLTWYPYGNDVLIAELAPYKVHHGLDFPNPPGTPVLAAGSGTVVHAGVKRSPVDGVSYYGNTVIVKHDWQWQGQDVYTLYAHTLELFVEVGDYVEQGQLLAGVGATGIVSGPHLHLEVRVGENQYWNTRNPMLWIAPYEGWGTLAGRVVDELGKYITGAVVSVKPLDGQGPEREQYTYVTRDFKSDDVWRENFVIGDLPAGRYEVTIKSVQTYRHTVNVLPGRTNFMEVQTDFVFSPPTPTPTSTAPVTGTVPLEPVE